MTRGQGTADSQTQNNVVTDSENEMLQNDVLSLEEQRTESNDLNDNSNKDKEEKHVFRLTFDEHLIPVAFEKYKPLIQKDLFLLHPFPNVLESAQNTIMGRKESDVPRFDDGMQIPIPYRWDLSCDNHTNGPKVSKIVSTNLIMHEDIIFATLV